MRTATVSIPPVVAYGTASPFSTIMVRGPGQKASESFLASSGTVFAMRSKSEKSDMCTISGLSDGRPFALYIFFDASGSKASPPSPYTVSVGNATSSPAAIKSPASCMSLWSKLS